MEQSLEQLKRIMRDYDYFSCIAEKLEWLDVEEQYEEQEPGYWDVSREERRQRLKAEYMLYWYEQYATFAELRLMRRDWTYLANEIKSFAVKNDVLPFSYQKQYLISRFLRILGLNIDL